MENRLGISLRGLNVFDGVAMLIALGLVGAGYFIGTIGSGGEAGETIPVEFTVTPNDQSRPLPPGSAKTFTLYVHNPKDYGVRVAAISEGSSTATDGGCPAGAVTSAPVENPTGFISPAGYRAYDVSVTMAANVADKCTGQSFILPLTVELASAVADR
ncbi:MAG: hypothetical protein ACRDRR_17205 [Pseudonocardiaceae bacterium]